MIRQPIKTRWTVLLGVISVLTLLMAYTAISYRQHRRNPDDTTIPSWSQLVEGVQKMVEVNPRSGERWLVVDAKATATRLFLGLALGILGAIIVGLLMGCFATMEGLLLPPMSILAKEPPTAMLAVFFVLVGTNTPMFLAMIGFGILPTMAQSIYLAVRNVHQESLFKAYTLGASHTEVVWNIIVRDIFPAMLDAIRLQIGPAMVYLIAAEMVVGDVGFGYRIRLQSRLLNMNVVYPYLAMLAMLGFSMDFMLRLLQKVTCPWHIRKGSP